MGKHDPHSITKIGKNIAWIKFHIILHKKLINYCNTKFAENDQNAKMDTSSVPNMLKNTLFDRALLSCTCICECPQGIMYTAQVYEHLKYT